ncbi:hypothetical protein HRbin23_01208 [bacterium HR23]|nr:hypothetical protein HRbin23_01208 [bacterium HR23]
MVDVRPFRGWRYRPSAVDDLSLVVSPPYDVVRVDQRGLLYQRSPYNVIRLEFGLSYPDDSPEDNVYTRAAHLLHQWRVQGVLGEEVSPAFYVLEEVFPYKGHRLTRRGLLGAVRLEPYERKVVFPHEHTSPGPKADRLRLLEATRASFSPILGLHRPHQGLRALLEKITAGPPQVQTRGWDNITYRLWIVTEGEVQQAIRSALAQEPVYLADGHHRYETALAYEAQRQQAGFSHPDDAFHFVPMCLVGMDDPGLVVEAFHRLVEPLPSALRQALLSRQEALFASSEETLPLTRQGAEGALEALARGKGTLACADRETGQLRLLRLRSGRLDIHAPHPSLWECASWVLHKALLEPVLGTHLKDGEGTITFVHGLEEVFQRLERGVASLAYLLPPVRWDVFRAVVEAGLRLPPKSTYFYPKLPAGLVIYSVEGRLPAL